MLRNPHSLKSWLRYIESREDAPGKQINILYERALRELPGSYKLWYKYLTVKREQVTEVRLVYWVLLTDVGTRQFWSIFLTAIWHIFVPNNISSLPNHLYNVIFFNPNQA